MANIKYKSNGEYKDIVVKVGDTLPIGAIIGFDTTQTIPNGWEYYAENQIKKIAPVTPANGNIENTYGTSQENTYSQEFLNGYELYKNITSSNIGGGDTPITLSDSIANYRKIKIYFDRYGIQKSVEIYTDILPVTNTIGVVLDIQLFLNGIYRLYTSYYTLSGTTMTLSSRAFWNSDGQPPTTQADNQIRISRVIGYK